MLFHNPMQPRFRIITAILTINLLVAQVGLNVFLIHCCCSKTIEYSFFPKTDPCLNGSSAQQCSATPKKTCHSKTGNAPCSRQIIEYKTLDLNAEGPAGAKLLALNTPVLIDHFQENLELQCSVRFASGNFEYPWKLSGTEIIDLHCTRLC